ncbi:hypothetical protein VNO77_14020 [Canavalia gladiata]|uniref:Uncharacterized protein n=1 Tax=Canavalia gladiata TaxID=3824 RepID=A0AAN9QQT3_CANGL
MLHDATIHSLWPHTRSESEPEFVADEGWENLGRPRSAEVRLSLKFDAPTEENPALLTPAGRSFFSVAAYNNGKRGGPNDLSSQRIASEGVAVRKRDAYRCGGMTEVAVVAT